MASENLDDPTVELLWLQEQRGHVLEYLANEGLPCDGLSESPAWFVVPYVSIWCAIRRNSEPQMWIICGDLPADCIQSNEVTNVREAMRAFALRWRELALSMMRGERHSTLNVGCPENERELGVLLEKRAGILQQWANDDSIWLFAKRPIHLPPEPILRAYIDLLTHTFVFLRHAALTKDIEPQELSDLADALHNVPDILLDYGRWTNEANYREGYLRPFDKKWAQKAFSLEEFVRERLKMYSKDAGAK